MQRDSRLFSKKASRSLGYEAGGYALESPAGACYADGEALTGMKHHEFPGPLNGVEFQPSETCPENFVIFDQTYSKSRVMFHPSLAHNFGSSSFDIDGAHAHEAGKSMDRDNGNRGEYPSCYEDDAEAIDALLSSEEDDDDDVVSTGRTPGNWGGSTSSCSFSEGTKCSKLNATNASSSKTKREKMKRMVGTLRGIIPGGGDQMDTPAVLDEAVKYLKSLKVDVKKLGAQNFDS
ncbi:transcription factor bHLH144-like [Phoenix dactylifera]|uniref:Transcription factor bHLH144-like n=1 Tax=Phoenix dactylifera TaxID=42345 RepID=A0A8B8J0L5_PHODC|nr:transcription factor bHLH144-like [Phoenix dactylifera]XP_026657735.2 transcription factor bHLH144-like [Phoenix dactylifera]XP_026657761.2 transcription factor bHLH144-like [Phoenix dactylifera]XP_038986121.1 transcription factor bHLH144-like [Phoenix dactylifera]XP_038986122.1 transcription factor bHLH144-like [Phoenix dactylifera]